MHRDYFALLRRLLPPGAAWLGEKFNALLKAISLEFNELDIFIEQVSREQDPREATISGWLSDHEADLGLPDECTAPGLKEADRQRIAHTKLAQSPDMSRRSIEKIIRDFGFDGEITYDTYQPCLCGIARCGDRIGDSKSNYYTIINIDDSASAAMTATLQCTISKATQPNEIVGVRFLQKYGTLTFDTTHYTWDTSITADTVTPPE